MLEYQKLYVPWYGVKNLVRVKCCHNLCEIPGHSIASYKSSTKLLLNELIIIKQGLGKQFVLKKFDKGIKFGQCGE